MHKPIPRCQHIKVNGTQCGSPSLRDQNLCYFHSRHQLKQTDDCVLQLPTLEDADAIQVALQQVIYALANNQLESKRAGLILFALQTASYNLKRTKFEPSTYDVVRDTPAKVVYPFDSVEFFRSLRRMVLAMKDPGLYREDREIVEQESRETILQQRDKQAPFPPAFAAATATKPATSSLRQPNGDPVPFDDRPPEVWPPIGAPLGFTGTPEEYERLPKLQIPVPEKKGPE